MKTYFTEILIKIQKFSFNENAFQMLFVKMWAISLGLNVATLILKLLLFIVLELV